jgi:hypothetical protein
MSGNESHPAFCTIADSGIALIPLLNLHDDD